MTCKLSERVTEGIIIWNFIHDIFGKHLIFVSGEGKSKKAAKNDAAEKMLRILEDEEL